MPSTRLRASMRTATALLAALLAGCYSYVPVSAADAPIGTSVRARISAAEAERIAPILNREDRTLEGNLLERTAAGEVVIGVAGTIMTEASSTIRGYQRIVVHPQDLQSLERRELNRTRTALVAGAAVAVVAAAALGAFANTSPDPGTGRPQQEHLRAPVPGALRVLWRVRLP